MAERLTADAALALLANTLATASGLVVLVTVLAPISGAHLNPAVTLVMALRREHPWPWLLPYALAQLLGAASGVWLAHAMFAEPLWQVSATARDGASQALSEGVATFGLLLAVLGARHRPDAVPALVGLWIASAYWFTASTSFANPAVTFARALTSTFAGIAPASVPAFLLAQLAGAALAWALAGWLLRR